MLPRLLQAQGSRFFWRSKETIDVALHLNTDEGLMTISTRCPERGYNYPAIFVDVSKIPVHKSEAVSVFVDLLLLLSCNRQTLRRVGRLFGWMAGGGGMVG